MSWDRVPPQHTEQQYGPAMNPATSVATARRDADDRGGRRSPRDTFYAWSAVAAALIVFAGFARTYYLKELFGTRSLPLLLHVHGLVMTLWFVLFLVQVRLVAAHRTDLHRRLGVIGAVLALLVVVVGATTIIVRGKPHFRPGHSLAGLAFQLSILLVFAVLVGAAIVFRRRSDLPQAVDAARLR